MQILRRALRGWVDALPGNEVDSLPGLVTFELCTRSVLVMDRLVRSGMNFHQRRTHPHSYRGEQKKSWPAPFGPIFSGTARSGCATCLRKSRWKKRKERKKTVGERRANICCTQAPVRSTLLQCFGPLFIAADCEYAAFEHDVSLK